MQRYKNTFHWQDTGPLTAALGDLLRPNGECITNLIDSVLVLITYGLNLKLISVFATYNEVHSKEALMFCLVLRFFLRVAKGIFNGFHFLSRSAINFNLNSSNEIWAFVLRVYSGCFHLSAL